jgi:hypothetical protein
MPGKKKLDIETAKAVCLWPLKNDGAEIAKSGERKVSTKKMPL